MLLRIPGVPIRHRYNRARFQWSGTTSCSEPRLGFDLVNVAADDFGTPARDSGTIAASACP
jgi:hypothetical protein